VPTRKVLVVGEAVPGAQSIAFFATALPHVKDRIARAARKAGRDPANIRLMAVTKGFPKETVQAAIAAGVGLLGENRVQEAELKYAEISGNYELHLIGHLQRNKARTATALFSCVQTIDKLETATALESRLEERGKTIDVLLELNTSGEASKSGFRSQEELLACLEPMASLSHLRLRGLMTVGPLAKNGAVVRESFATLRGLFEKIKQTLPDFTVLSMGMSGDFETAIEEGSTIVRIGTALFGPRQAKQGARQE
jgi:hypothetical protein